MTEEPSQENLQSQDVSEPATMQAEAAHIDHTTTKLSELEEEVAKLKDMYLRSVAETENVRNRAKRDLDESAKYAVTKFARDMVNLVENLDRASQSITTEARGSSDVMKQVGDGIDMAMQEMLGIFERNGIKRINPAGEKFDHNFHQAVAQVESAETPAGNVVQVLQAGYVLHDRLLRPAMVSVAAQPNKHGTADSAA
jgi:molecular chaperone GrpE